MTSRQYLLDNAAPQAGDRFAALAATFDPVTFDRLNATGVGPGWRCWEVGAGGPTVPAWLADRVGPSGRVVATDIDPGWLDSQAAFEVVRHDVAQDPPVDRGFDLVHCRLVLVHVPGRLRGLANMVDALAPGGWLVVEDFDPALLPDACLDPVTDAERRANRIRREFLELLAGRGVDLAYGRALPRLLRDAGLVDVSARATFPVSDPAARDLELANVLQVADGLTAGGAVAATELDAHVAALRRGELDVATPPLVSAVGRKPDGAT